MKDSGVDFHVDLEVDGEHKAHVGLFGYHPASYLAGFVQRWEAEPLAYDVEVQEVSPGEWLVTVTTL